MSNFAGDWIAFLEFPRPDHYAPSALVINADGTIEDELSDMGKWVAIGDHILLRFLKHESTFHGVITGDVMVGVYGFSEATELEGKGRWYAIRRGTATT
jgi:hypothetical protein